MAATHVTAELADALADALNAEQEWEIPFVALRRWVPHLNRSELHQPEMRIIPVRMDEQRVLDRSFTRVSERHTVGACLQAALDDKDDNAAVDLWANALQRLADWTRELKTLETDDWRATYQGVELVVVNEHLMQLAMFTGYAFVDWTVFR